MVGRWIKGREGGREEDGWGAEREGMWVEGGFHRRLRSTSFSSAPFASANARGGYTESP